MGTRKGAYKDRVGQVPSSQLETTILPCQIQTPQQHLSYSKLHTFVYLFILKKGPLQRGDWAYS